MKTLVRTVVGMMGLCCLSLSLGRACSCDRQSVASAYNNATIVFEGKIVAIEGAVTAGSWPAGTVRFEVTKNWKGDLRSEVEMPAVTVGGSCLGFYSFLLKPGSELLVYAKPLVWTPKGEKAFFTDACARTRLLKSAQEDLSILEAICEKTKSDRSAQETKGRAK
ncbi:MAG: hypothetical protein NTY38_02975 [Acidobacteria bacterium]|nr:hypothetical protein [Acidobacteriota bacterium]